MTKILELPGKKFNVTMTNMLKVSKENAGWTANQRGDFSRRLRNYEKKDKWNCWNRKTQYQKS